MTRFRLAAISLVAAVFASSLVASVDNTWFTTGITKGKRPVRYVVTKTGWRSGPEAMVVDDPAEARGLYSRLAGNSRVTFTCGYHWNFLFEYSNGDPEWVDINEKCEEFKTDSAATWKAVEAAFTLARTHSRHTYVVVSEPDTAARIRLEKILDPGFGVVLPLPEQKAFYLASRKPWTPERLNALRRICGPGASVEVPKEWDAGS